LIPPRGLSYLGRKHPAPRESSDMQTSVSLRSAISPLTLRVASAAPEEFAFSARIKENLPGRGNQSLSFTEAAAVMTSETAADCA
jgi:hypothetical protein